MAADLDVLLVQLQDGRPEVRIKAARALAEDPDPFARKSILQALKDRNPEVRYWAVCGLARMLDSQTQQELLQLMQDASRLVRLEVIRALSQYPGPTLIEPLLERLGDPDEDVREEAARALSCFRETFFGRILGELSSSSWNRRHMVYRSMLMAGDRASSAISHAIRKDNLHKESLYWLLKLVGEMRMKGEQETVLRILEHAEDEEILAVATQALAQIGGSDVLGSLMQLMEHPSTRVRDASIEALGGLGEHAISTLIDRLDDDSRIIRLHSAEALGRIGDVTIGPLIEKFYERDKEGRFWILSALRRMHLPFTLGIFKTLCHEEDTDIQLLSIQSLGDWQQDEEVLEILLELLDHSRWKVRAEAARSIARLKPSLEILIRELEEGGSNRRYWVVQIFEMLNDPRSIPALIGLFSQDDWVLRTAVAEALGRMDNLPRELVLQELESGDESRVFWMTKALNKSQDRLFLDALLKTLQFKQSGINANVMSILKGMGATAYPRLVMVFSEKWPRQVYEIAAEILSEDAKTVRRFLPELMESSHKEAHFWAVFMAEKASDEILDILHTLLQHSDWKVRLNALKALTQKADSSSLEPLLEILEDEYPALRREAVVALGRIPSEKILGYLKPLLESEDLEMKLAVIQSLGRMHQEEALHLLLAELSNEHWLVRREILRSFASFARNAPSGLRQEIAEILLARLPLKSMLPDGFFREWFKVAEGCAHPLLAASIREVLPGPNLDFTSRGLKALMECEPTYEDAVGYMRMEDSGIRHLSIEILAASRDERSIQPLKQMLVRSDPSLRVVVRKALRELLGEEKWAELLEEHVKNSREEQAEKFYRNALDLVSARQFEEALQAVNQACALSDRIKNQSLKARILAELKQYTKAEQVFLKILRERPEDVKTLYNLAMLHYVQGNFERTENLFVRLMEKENLPEEIQGLIGRIRQKMVSVSSTVSDP